MQFMVLSILLALLMLSCRTSGSKQADPPTENPIDTPTPEVLPTPAAKDPYADYIEQRKKENQLVEFKWKTEQPIPLRGRRDGYFQGLDYNMELVNPPKSRTLHINYDFSFDSPATCKSAYFELGPSLYDFDLKHGLSGRLSALIPAEITSCTLQMQAKTLLAADRILKTSRLITLNILRKNEITWDDALPKSILTLRDEDIKIQLKLQKLDPFLSEPLVTYAMDPLTCADAFSDLKINPQSGLVSGHSQRPASCDIEVTATPLASPPDPAEKITRRIHIDIQDKPERPVLVNLSSQRNLDVRPFSNLSYDFASYDANGDLTVIKVKSSDCPWKWTFLDMGASETFPYVRNASVMGCAWAMKLDQICYVDFIAASNDQESEPYRIQFRMKSVDIPAYEDMDIFQKLCAVFVVNQNTTP